MGYYVETYDYCGSQEGRFTFSKNIDSLWQEDFGVLEGKTLLLRCTHLNFRNIFKLSLGLPEAVHLIEFTGDYFVASLLPLARALEHSQTLQAISLKFQDSRTSELMRLGLALAKVKTVRLDYVETSRMLFSLGKCLEAYSKKKFRCNFIAIKVPYHCFRLSNEAKYFLSSVEKYLSETNYLLEHWVNRGPYRAMFGEFDCTVSSLPANQSTFLRRVVRKK